MIQRSRFARLSVNLQKVNQKEMSHDIDEDSSINTETKVLLKNLVELSTQKKESIRQDRITAESSPVVKSPMTYRRGNSMILLKNLDITRIQQAENEGYLKKSRFNSQKQFEERKVKLQEALNQKEKIDVKDPYIQNSNISIQNNIKIINFELQILNVNNIQSTTIF